MAKYYHTCPICGANLDPGEPCECQGNQTEPEEIKEEKEDGCNDKD